MNNLESFLKKKDKWRRTVKKEHFAVNGANCAVAVSGRLSYTVRLYCSYPLLVECNSLAHRALKTAEHEREHFEFDIKQEKQDGIYYETIKKVKKCYYKKKQAALEAVQTLRRECEEPKGYVDPENYPDKLKRMLPYCKVQKRSFTEEYKALLNTMPQQVKVRELESGQESKIRAAIKKISEKKKGYGWKVTKLAAALEIVPFSYCGTSVQFFLVKMTRFYIKMKIQQDKHVEYCTNYDVVERAFCFMVTSDKKYKNLSESFTGPDFVRNFAEKRWNTLTLDTKDFFRAITTQTIYKISQRNKIATYLTPGSIIRINDTKVAVYMGNNELVQIVGRREPNDGKVFKFGSVENFLANCKEFKQIKFIVNRFETDVLRKRAETINEENKYDRFIKNSCDENAYYLVTGMNVSLKGGFMEKVLSKLPLRTVVINDKYVSKNSM